MTTTLKYLGISIIIIFSAISTLFYSIEKELPLRNRKDNMLLTYSSFFEDRFLDFRMKFPIDRQRKANNIVLAEFNDESLKRLGRWPWPRGLWAQVVDKLKHYGAKVIAFDVFFSEPEEACNTQSSDSLLAKSFNSFQEIPGNKILIPYSLNISGQFQKDDYKNIPETLYNFILSSQSAPDTNLENHYVSRKVYPIYEFLNSNIDLGYIASHGDSDGVFRNYYLVSNIDGIYLPSFALQAYQAYTGDKTHLNILSTLEQAELVTQTGRFPINQDGTMKIRWFGGVENFESITIHDLLEADENDPYYKNILKGNLVFIASMAFGIQDSWHTPIDNQLPSVYAHMNVINMLLSGFTFLPRHLSTQYTWYLLIFCTLIFVLVQLLGNPIIDLITVFVLIAGIFSIDIYYFIPKGHDIRPLFCLFSLLGCYFWTTFLNFYLSGRDKKYFQNTFKTYLSPNIIDQMYLSGERPKLGGESGIRTAFFSDIEGFSAFSEVLSVRNLVELLNEYLTAMTNILLEEGGTLDKYEGDAIIAFFGAPLMLKDHAQRSCLTAYKMQKELKNLRIKWSREQEKWPSIVHNMHIRIGINTGKMVTGNMGSLQRMNYTMMGDAVNVASRLESSAKHYGVSVHVSKETKEQSGLQFLWREIDTIRLVGKIKPITTFELLGKQDECCNDLLKLVQLFKQGIDLYNVQEFEDALEIFHQTLSLENERPFRPTKQISPSLVYQKRCNNLLKHPPKDWDGTWIFHHK